MPNVQIEIPFDWLLKLSDRGFIGKGEQIKTVRYWAKSELIKAGRQNEYEKMQRENLEKLQAKAKRVLGKELDLTKIF